MTTTLPQAQPHCTFGQMSRNVTALVVTLTLVSHITHLQRAKAEFHSSLNISSLELKGLWLSLSVKGFLKSTYSIKCGTQLHVHCSTGRHFPQLSVPCHENYLSWVLSASCPHVLLFITTGVSNSIQVWMVANNISLCLSAAVHWANRERCIKLYIQKQRLKRLREKSQRVSTGDWTEHQNKESFIG